MFKKLLASVGIGKAKVDTYVLSESLRPGGECELNVVIRGGGSVAQDINGLTLSLCTNAKSETEMGDTEVTTYHTKVISSMALTPQDFGMHSSELQPDEVFEYSLNIVLDDETPVTAFANSTSKVWIATGLDIDKGLDSSDKDFLVVHPTEFQQTILNIMEELGYRLFKVDVESGVLRGNGFQSTIGCYQEFEFKGASGFFSTTEVEISFVNTRDSVGVLLEKDRFLGGDAYYSRVFDVHASRQEIEAQLKSWL